MASMNEADQPYEFVSDTLPLQITVHNATAVLSSVLLATLIAYVTRQLYRLRVHLPPLPRALRNILWFIFAEPRLASLPPIISQIIRFTFFSVMTYLVSWYWTRPDVPGDPSPRIFGGLATMTLRDGSTSTYTLSDADAFSTFLASSLSDVATGKWVINMQPPSSTAPPTLS